MENFDQYYRSYKYMQKHLNTDFTANYLTTNMEDNDKGSDVLSGKLHEKVIDMEWVTAIEDTLPYIEKAIDEQRRFIMERNEVYRVDKAKIINKDSVKHLIQHTNFIDKIDDNGKVTPNKVLTIEREDSFETYENRFLITLIENALNFVADKYHKMVNAPTDTYNKVEMERDMVLNNQHITFKVEYSNEVKDAKADQLDVKEYEKLSDFDRVRRIREKLNSFLNTDMMIALKKCIRVISSDTTIAECVKTENSEGPGEFKDTLYFSGQFNFVKDCTGNGDTLIVPEFNITKDFDSVRVHGGKDVNVNQSGRLAVRYGDQTEEEPEYHYFQYEFYLRSKNRDLYLDTDNSLHHAKRKEVR